MADPLDACAPFTTSDTRTPWVALISREQSHKSLDCTFDIKASSSICSSHVFFWRALTRCFQVFWNTQKMSLCPDLPLNHKKQCTLLDAEKQDTELQAVLMMSSPLLAPDLLLYKLTCTRMHPFQALCVISMFCRVFDFFNCFVYILLLCVPMHMCRSGTRSRQGLVRPLYMMICTRASSS